MTQSYQPIETAAGLISGRDAIFLDEVRVSLYPRVLELRGELNSTLCSKYQNDDLSIKYCLTFSRVIAYAMTELDFKDHLGASSFDLVIDSDWLEEMRRKDHSAKIKPTHKHFLVFTYDDVFDIACENYELKLIETRVKPNRRQK